MFHLTRAFHLAGRCISCGECERVCPVEIPLMKLNRKVEKDVKELLKFQAGMDPAAVFARNRFAPRPDLVILLTMQLESSLARIRESRGEELNDFEQEDQLRRVAELFASFADPCITRNAADDSLENVARKIQRAVDRLFLDKDYPCPRP